MRRISFVVPLALLTACGGGGNSNPDAGGSGNPDGGSQLVTCPAAVPAATSGTCDASGSGANLLLHAGAVLGAGTVYENGYVLVEGDTITCVGCDCDSQSGAASARVVSCADAVVSPGLINPHDHLRYTEGAPIDHGATRYDHRHEWRGSLSTPQNPDGTGQTAVGMQWGEMRMALGGATSMVGSGRALGMLRNLDDPEPAEQTRGFQQVDFETFSLGDSNETFHANCGWSYAVDEQTVAAEPAFLPHVAEGINDYAAEEFRCQSTSFDGGQDFTEKNTAHIHAIGLTAADYYKMARHDAQIIWSPRSNISLYGMTAEVTTFARLGGIIALGTDWTYSGSANVLRELACADSFNRDYLASYFTDEELWKMATVNAARATASEDLIGTLENGKVADIAVFASRGRGFYRAVIEAGDADVALTLKGGVPLTGEADTLTELGESCDPVTVCGDAHEICATREFGTSYDSLATTAASAYPAVLCDTPAGEPSCVPSRPSEFTGELTATDADGDGIADASDNCPNVFNPIRPIDNGVQPDGDGDGMGDPCDPTPLPDDLDNDTVANDADNCPFDSNTSQTDGDMDNKGDACDFCPMLANPDGVCPAGPPTDTTIVDIQNGTVAAGSHVKVSGVTVTSVFGTGVTVQDPNAASAPYSGIYVFTGSAPGLTIGQSVDVVGDVEEYFDNTELTNTTVTPVGSATPITPVSITSADAASEPYEGVLVRITDVQSTDATWDCSVDNASCTDMNLWQINGPADSILVYDLAYQDSDWASHVGQTPLSGVMTYRHNRRRIMPRTAADF